MPHGKPTTTIICRDPRDQMEHIRVRACNRIILYTRGLDMGAMNSLELAMECLRRAGSEAGMDQIMNEMHLLLKEQGINLSLASLDGQPLRCAPPLRRTSMVSDSVKLPSLTGWLTGVVGIMIGPLRNLIWKRQKA